MSFFRIYTFLCVLHQSDREIRSFLQGNVTQAFLEEIQHLLGHRFIFLQKNAPPVIAVSFFLSLIGGAYSSLLSQLCQNAFRASG